ncbi:hypothetical protein AMAG_05623 [Allomyces macrogynus ATCC 38327]|uniref:Cyclic nucleotide-binding domain-containing protein n=1 Tax=Allomyces macrogynus (strain ATCC 38327) TaxID=578462 RepID=A0A0L0SCT6_ALLM3|nr:hypothetical protein AMAG_05623 [Allomyces macrogynus ATCC 38327]|eukprot:KNE60205.1 hypothetical protein AMAG_05623 [Allomyces macrogynus ATCC 38327]
MADMNYPRPERTAAPGNDPARTFAASPRTRRPSLPARPHVAMGFIQPVARPLGATDGPAQSSTDSVEGPFLSTTDLPGSLSGSTSGLGLGIPKAPVNIVPRRRSPLSATPLSMVDGPSNQGRPRSPSPLRASSSALSSRVAGSVDFGSRVGANPSGSASHVAASPSGSVLHGLNGGMGTGSSDFVARNVQMPVSRRNSAASLDDSNRGTQRPRAASSPLALLAFSAALASSSAPRPADPRPIPDPQPDAAHKTTPDIPFPSDMPAPRGPPVPVGPKELDTLQEVEEHDANPLALGQVSASAVGLLSASNGPPPSPSPQSPEPEIDQDAASFDAMIPADPFARSSFSEDGSNPFIKPAWVIRIEAWLCPRLAPVKAYLDYVAQTPEARFWLAWDVLGRIVHVIMFCLIPVVASFPCDFALDFMHSFIALDVMVIFMVLFDLVRPRTNEYGQVETRWREKRRIFFRRPTNWIKVFNAIPFDWYIISTLDKLGNATCSHPHYVYSDKTVVGAPLAHVPDGVEFLGKRFMYNAHEIPAEITFYAAARLFRLLPVVQTLFWFTELKLPLVSKPVGRLIKTLVYSFLLTQLNACFFWMLDTYIDDEDRYIQKILKDPSGIPTNFTYRFARNFAAAQKANFFLPRDGEVTAEVIFQIAEMLVSCLCYGSLFGNMAAIAKSFDTGAVQEKAVKLRLYRKDYLRNFMIARKFSPGLQAKVLNHEAFSWAHKQGYEVDELFDDLPGPLRLEVYSHLYFDLISRVSLFKNVDERFKVAVAERIITITVPNGFYACKAGDVGEELFLIQSGSVAVMPADESKVFATLTAGVCFGEIALLENTTRTATCKATSDTTLCVLRKKDFDDIFLQNPSMAEALRTIVSTHKANDEKRKAEQAAAAAAQAATQAAAQAAAAHANTSMRSFGGGVGARIRGSRRLVHAHGSGTGSSDGQSRVSTFLSQLSLHSAASRDTANRRPAVATTAAATVRAMADRFKSPASTMRRNSSMPSSHGSAHGTVARTAGGSGARAPTTMPRGSKSFTASQTMIPTALLAMTNSDVAKDPAGLPPRGVVATAQLLDTEGTALDLRPRAEQKGVTGVVHGSRSMTAGSVPMFDPLQTMETLIGASGPLKPLESGNVAGGALPLRDGATLPMLPLSPVPSGLELPLDDVLDPGPLVGNGTHAAYGVHTANGAHDASTAGGLRPRPVDGQNGLAPMSGRSSKEVCARTGHVADPDNKNASPSDADDDTSLLTVPTSTRTALSSGSSGTGVDINHVDTS